MISRFLFKAFFLHLLVTAPLQAKPTYLDCDVYIRLAGQLAPGDLEPVSDDGPKEFSLEQALADATLAIRSPEAREGFMKEVMEVGKWLRIQRESLPSPVGVRLPLLSRVPRVTWNYAPSVGEEESARALYIRRVLDSVRAIMEARALAAVRLPDAWSPWRQGERRRISYLTAIQRQIFYQYHVLKGLLGKPESEEALAKQLDEVIPKSPSKAGIWTSSLLGRPFATYRRAYLFRNMVLNQEVFHQLNALADANWYGQFAVTTEHTQKYVEKPVRVIGINAALQTAVLASSLTGAALLAWDVYATFRGITPDRVRVLQPATSPTDIDEIRALSEKPSKVQVREAADEVRNALADPNLRGSTEAAVLKELQDVLSDLELESQAPALP